MMTQHSLHKEGIPHDAKNRVVQGRTTAYALEITHDCLPNGNSPYSTEPDCYIMH